MLALAGVVTSSGTARAGGFELPDNGAQAVGRGATFVAKADDTTAMYYNPAGLARQRGTRLYVGGNLFLHSYEFQRASSFPDDPNDASTPWDRSAWSETGRSRSATRPARRARRAGRCGCRPMAARTRRPPR